MRDLIIEKLNKMEDLEQRKLLKDIMSGFFLNLIDYQETMNKNLENRVFGEIDDIERKYDLYMTVCHKNDVDPVDEFLFPVFNEDVMEKKYDMKEIALSINRKLEVRLFTLFMKCSHEMIKALCKNKKKYRGTLVTAKKSYSVEMRIEQNRNYLNEVEKLYEVFQKNSIPWKTANNPYANKFFDVILTDCDGILDESEEIQEIKFDLEEYEPYKMADMVLMWNIRRLKLKSDGFPMPAKDKVNFEHVISLKKTGIDHGYLVDGDENQIRYIMRSTGEITIVSPEEKAGAWNVLKITQASGGETRKLDFELVSNCRKQSFINRYAQKQSSIIRTRGEIKRIASSFEISKYFELIDIEISDKRTISNLTYDMNFFLIDDIRVGNGKKLMRLKFRAMDYDSFIREDILSFIVSEIQMYFSEYECQGELI